MQKLRIALAVVLVLIAVGLWIWRLQGYQKKKMGAMERLIENLGQRRMGQPLVDPSQFKPFGERAIPRLMEIAKSTERNTLARQQAIEALGYVGDESTVPFLKEFLQDQSQQLRSAALRALAELGTPNAIKVVVECLKDEQLRGEAIELINEHQFHTAKDALIKLLDDADRSIAGAAARALGKLGAREALSKMRAMFKDTATHLDAAIALAYMGEKDGVQALIETLGSDNSAAVRRAMDALKEVGDVATDAICDAAQRGAIAVRVCALQLLGELKPPKAMEILSRATEDKNNSIKVAALEALGKIGDARAAGILIRSLSDENPNIWNVAVHALSDISIPVDVLNEAIRSKDARVREGLARALGMRHDPKTFDIVIKLLGDKNANVRRRAAIALMAFNDKRAIPFLKKHLNDPDEGVQRAVQSAIRVIETK